MRCIHHFQASDVFGHLNVNLDFFEDLTFVYGLNGSGKTTALKLIMALLSPSIRTLTDVPFSNASIIVERRAGGSVSISCTKTEAVMSMTVSDVTDTLELDLRNVDPEEMAVYVERKHRMHPTVKAIRDLSSPIFLGLERRFQTPAQGPHLPPSASRQMALQFEREKNMAHRPDYDPGLAEVAAIIDDFVRRLKIRQETADNQFRKQLLLDSFAYVDPRSHGFSLGTPDEKMFGAFRGKRDAILDTLKNLDLVSDEFEKTSEDFFSALEATITKIQTKAKHRKQKGKATEIEPEYSEALAAWFVNQPQVDRIQRIFHLVNQYEEQRDLIYKGLNDFTALVNKFLGQTGKAVVIGKDGSVTIKAGGRGTPIQALSSGERQILIMLAHLSLNPRLRKDGIFIVDEPELSLHMAWQDMFVEAVQTANPRLQIILATHAPAIIGGRNNKCIPVTRTGC